MPINNGNVYVKRISLPATPDLGTAIKEECDTQSGMNPPMRLVVAFEIVNNMILVFQSGGN